MVELCNSAHSVHAQKGIRNINLLKPNTIDKDI